MYTSTFYSLTSFQCAACPRPRPSSLALLFSLCCYSSLTNRYRLHFKTQCFGSLRTLFPRDCCTFTGRSDTFTGRPSIVTQFVHVNGSSLLILIASYLDNVSVLDTLGVKKISSTFSASKPYFALIQAISP